MSVTTISGRRFPWPQVQPMHPPLRQRRKVQRGCTVRHRLFRRGAAQKYQETQILSIDNSNSNLLAMKIDKTSTPKRQALKLDTYFLEGWTF